MQQQQIVFTVNKVKLLTNITTTHQGNVSIDLVFYNNQKYALKLTIRKEYIIQKNNIENIKNEKRALLELSHPCINKLIATDQDNLNIYMLLEFIEGIPIHRLLQNIGQLNIQFTCLIMQQLLWTFIYIHEQGWIYRDLKASNLIIQNDFRIKLIDFGLAKQINKQRTSSFSGTIHSMPPEVLLRQEYDYSYDYYSLGILFYELLTGKPPFGLENENLKENIIKGIQEEQLNQIKDEKIRNIIQQQLNNDPKKRMNCQQMLQQIPNFNQMEVLDFIENTEKILYQNNDYDEEICNQINLYLKDLYCTQYNFQNDDQDTDQ